MYIVWAYIVVFDDFGSPEKYLFALMWSTLPVLETG